jgi:hypothetical protein
MKLLKTILLIALHGAHASHNITYGGGRKLKSRKAQK